MGKIARNKVKKYRNKGKKKSRLEGVSKPKSEQLPILLGHKKSDGTANWDKLSKMLGFSSQKTSPKSSASKTKFKQTAISGKNFKSKKLFSNGNIENVNSILRPSGSKPITNETFPAIRDIGNSLPPLKPKTRFLDGSKNISASTVPQDETKEKRLTKCIAMDCEMVGTGDTGRHSMIARVSLVNQIGDCVYDVYVKPKDDITDYRTYVSGIRPADLVDGKDLYTVQEDVLKILEGRMLVGHSLKNDLDVLFISHPKFMIRDTSKYRPFREMFSGQTPSLKKLTAKLLGVDIQTGEHSSVEDARAAMQLYVMNKSEWERSIKLKKKMALIRRRPMEM